MVSRKEKKRGGRDRFRESVMLVLAWMVAWAAAGMACRI